MDEGGMKTGIRHAAFILQAKKKPRTSRGFSFQPIDWRSDLFFGFLRAVCRLLGNGFEVRLACFGELLAGFRQIVV